MKFYNAGDRISEAISFSLPGQVTASSGNLIAHWMMDAPAASFFNVPTMITLAQDNTRLNVDFPATVLQRFGDRGVVMIDEDWDPGEDEDRAEREPFAVNDAGAKAKGEAKWWKYLRAVVQNHMNACDRARAAGGFPLEAQGFTKRAFKLMNMEDPAAMVFDSFKGQARKADAPAQVQSAEAEQFRKELAETNQKLEKLLAGLAAKEQIETADAIEDQAQARTQRSRKSA